MRSKQCRRILIPKTLGGRAASPALRSSPQHRLNRDWYPIDRGHRSGPQYYSSSLSSLQPRETCKLEYRSLDLVCAAVMWNKHVPSILQGNARGPACIFTHKPLTYCISTNEGPEQSATCTGTDWSTSSARTTGLGALAEHLADLLFISTASNLFVPFTNLSEVLWEVVFSLGCSRIWIQIDIVTIDFLLPPWTLWSLKFPI
jgi:hypothetical protein